MSDTKSASQHSLNLILKDKTSYDEAQNRLAKSI